MSRAEWRGYLRKLPEGGLDIRHVVIRHETMAEQVAAIEADPSFVRWMSQTDPHSRIRMVFNWPPEATAEPEP